MANPTTGQVRITHKPQRPPAERPHITALQAALEHEHDESFEEGFEQGFESGLDHSHEHGPRREERYLRSINAWVITIAIWLLVASTTAYVTWLLLWPYY